jgi:L-alanine-DL-glutamate epimerase-like enolase superfamily enzyme
VNQAKDAGFLAAKLECLNDLMPDDADIAPLCQAIRAMTGPDFTLIADMGYRWRDAGRATTCLGAVEDVALRFIEAPLFPDDVEGYGRLCEALHTAVGGCEVLTCLSEYSAFLRRGALDVVQGSPNRLGIGDLHGLAVAARRHDRELVPFCYTATAIGYSAGLHVATANTNVPLLEYAPPYIETGGRLRAEIASPDPVLASDASFAVPSAPGLGVDVDWDAVERYRVDSR